MTEIVVTQAAVRKLAALLSKTDTISMRHGDRLDLIASTFGMRTDAFMHAIKTASKDKPKAACTTIELSPFEDQPWGRGVPLRKLGIRLCHDWELAAEQGSGVLISTGATGSGRSTTLNSTALHLARQGRFVRPQNEKRMLKCGKTGEVVLFGFISTPDQASLAYEFAERGMLVLAVMAHSPFDDLSMIRNMGITGERLELTRAIIHQKLVRKIAPKFAEGTIGPKYMGRTLVSSVHYFDKDHSVDKFLSSKDYKEMNFLSDLLEKVKAGIVDLEEIERVFSADVFKMFGRRLP
jgi:hypothetical protein